MHAELQTVTIDTTTAGTAYTGVVNGEVISIRYVKTDYATDPDFTITGETTGINIWTQSNVDASVTVCPRQPTASQAGVAALYGAGAAYAVNDRIVLANERIKIVVANGGTAKTGAFHVTINGTFNGAAGY